MSRLFGIVLIGSLSILSAGLAASDEGIVTGLPVCSSQPPYWCSDAAYFRADDSCLLEVYLRICNEGLQFVRSAEGYRASADISVVLKDKKNRQVAGDTYRMKLYSSRYQETTSVDSCRVRTLSFRIKPGDFRMVVTVYDRDSRTSSRLETPLNIPSLAGFPSLSDIELLSADGGESGARTPGFRPNARRLFDAEAGDGAAFYEVYQGDSTDSLVVSQLILDVNGEVIVDLPPFCVEGGLTRHLEKLPLDSLSNGRFCLEVRVAGAEGKILASRSKEFEVKSESSYWTQSMEEAVDLLTYIASSKLIELYREGDAETRKRIWEDFWRERDPTPTTPKNELYEEHLRRFRYANSKFSIALSEGWETDRGRIYILYGEPDEIDTYPFEVSTKPTEIWYYFARGRRFIFVDETGFGDYILVSESH